MKFKISKKMANLKRVMNEYKKLLSLENTGVIKYKIELPKQDNLNIMHIKLLQLTENRDSGIEKQMDMLKIPYILMEFILGEAYPYSPPFVRFITPKFVYRTGHITIGGSVCMELLTNQGWYPSCTLESLILQIVVLIIEGNGTIDEKNYKSSYTITEAKDAYNRVKQMHGWH